jgi:hypothetical protein
MRKSKHACLMRLSFNKIRYLFAIALILWSCSRRDEEVSNLPEGELKEIKSAVINRFNAMIKYSEAGELENVLSHFDPDAQGSYLDGGVRYPTFQDMLDNYRATWKIRKQDYGIPDTRMYVLSPRIVYVTSSSTLNTTSREGVVFKPRPWTISTLWTRSDGEWRIHSFHQFAPDPVPVEENQDVKE